MARRTTHSKEPSRTDIDHLLRIRRNDSRFDDEQVRIAWFDPHLDTVGVAGAEGFDAREVAQHASSSRMIQRLVDLEIVTITVDKRHLALERLRQCPELVDVIRIRVVLVRVGLLLLVAEVRVSLPDDHDAFRVDTPRVREPCIEPPEHGRLARYFLVSLT